MRVVHVSTWNEQCGIAAYAARLVRELDLLGLDQVVVGRAPRGKEEELGPPIPVRARYRPENPANAAAVVLASCRDADVVHLQFNFGLVPPAMLFRIVPELVRRRVRVVVTCHATRAAQDPLFGLRALPYLRGATVIVLGVARWPLEGLARRFLRIERVPLGVPTFPAVSMMAARERLGVLADPVISTSGFAFPHKRFELLIAALPELARRFPNVGLVGACTRYFNASSTRCIDGYHALAKRLGVEDRVIMSHDFLDDDALALRLFAGDVIALPYGPTRELASAAAAVALATGRRVAASRAGCFDGVRAFTEPLGDDVAADLAPLLAVPDAPGVAEARRAALEAEHGFGAIARRHLAIYESA